MGVGLFIVDQILRAHGGRIAVRSEPGDGATFVIHLPMGAATRPDIDDAVAPSRVRASSDGIDDAEGRQPGHLAAPE